jgi:L-ascorbate metabolism protein UlaG (beta-lactamase superfamily)
MHYATFPALTGTPDAFRAALQALGLNEVEVVEMKPGQTV